MGERGAYKVKLTTLLTPPPLHIVVDGDSSVLPLRDYTYTASSTGNHLFVPTVYSNSTYDTHLLA